LIQDADQLDFHTFLTKTLGDRVPQGSLPQCYRERGISLDLLAIAPWEKGEPVEVCVLCVVEL